MPSRRYLLSPAVAVALTGLSAPVGDDLFEKKIRPVLVEKCYGCHSSKLKAPMGALVLDTKTGTRQGGTSGPANRFVKLQLAAILHCLGLVHERLTYRYAGRDFRLTDVFGTVVKDILA